MKKIKQKPGVKPETGEARKNLVTIKLTDKELEDINKIAEILEIPRTRLIRNMVIASLKDAKFLDILGILKGVKNINDFTQRWLNPERYKTLYTDDS